MVRHKRMHNRIPLAAWQACLGVVDGFIQAKAPSRTLSGKALQVAAGGFGLDHQCQCAGVGRNHGILAQAALEPKAGDTEGSILVIEVGIQGVIARLGHAPGYAQPVAVLDLQGDGSAARLVQQRAFVAGHHQHRHQVLEHRAGPGKQHRHTPVVAEQASQGEPGLLRQLALRDDHEIGKTDLGSQQVVVAAVQPALVGVVANREEVALMVVEESELHVGQ
ncbi:hypothetical protein D3C84_172170 [compost metagenome]